MTRTCTICRHKDVDEINKRLLSGEPYRSIAKQFEASESAIYRHKDHIPVGMVKAQEAKEVASAGNLLDQAMALREKAYSILNTAEITGDLRTALAGIRESRECLELMGKLAVAAATLEQLRKNQEMPRVIKLRWYDDDHREQSEKGARGK